METITENHSQSKCGVAEPSSKDTSLTQFLNLRLVDYCGRRGKKTIKYKRIREFAISLCLLEISKEEALTTTTAQSCIRTTIDL